MDEPRLSTNDNPPPTRVPWPPLLLVAVFAGSWLLGRTVPLAWPGVDDPAARAVGLFLGALGFALIAWAAVTFRRHGTTILPNSSAAVLVTDGPFRWRRNPIYLGDVLIFLGIAEVTKNVWFVGGAAVFAILVTWLAILPEERHLETRFGDAYRDYRNRTRRWI
ncbi:MAG: methyltransferase family protein [Hyphomicrobium sp.]